MRAGDWASSVPDTLVAEGRYGVAVGEDVAAARRAFEDAIARAAAADPWLAEHPPEVEWWGGRFDPAVTDPADPIVTVTASAAADVAGAASPVEGVTYGADMRLLVNVGGIPTVLFGPGDVRVAHMPDENVPIDDLLVAAQALVVTAVRRSAAPGNSRIGPSTTAQGERVPFPEGYILRHPEVDEAPAVQAMMDAAESADTGESRRHEDDVATEWRDLKCRPAENWWVAVAPDGFVAAVGWVWPETAGEVTADLLRASGAPRPRAGRDDAGRDRGQNSRAAVDAGGWHAERRSVVWCEDSDVARGASLERRGFVAVRQYFEMATDLGGQLAAPVWPAA